MATNYETVIDPYAWIEYFRGSSSGEKAKQFIEKGSSATASITLAELQEKYLREGWTNFETDLRFIASRRLLHIHAGARRRSVTTHARLGAIPVDMLKRF